MNEQSESRANLAPRRKGMAITSKIIGTISFITCSFFLVGGISGLALGIIALWRAKKQPEIYGGETEAKRGIAYSALSLMVLLITVILLSDLLMPQQRAREAAAIREVEAINIAQLQYARTKGQGKYTDLHTLAREGLIDESLIAKGGYILTSNLVEGGDQPMYDITVRFSSKDWWGTGNKSFYSNETQVIYGVDSGESPTVTPQNRIPKNGRLLIP
jgi:hypothetical protein